MLPVAMPPDEVLDRYERELAAMRWYGDAWPKWWPNYGAGVGAAFLGAELHTAPETETVWFLAAAPAAIADLQPSFDPQNRWRRRVYDLTARAIARWGERMTVGYTDDIGGNLDILASLLGIQELLFALMDAPDEVKRLVGEITALWLRYYDELDALIRQITVHRLGQSQTQHLHSISPIFCKNSFGVTTSTPNLSAPPKSF